MVPIRTVFSSIYLNTKCTHLIFSVELHYFVYQNLFLVGRLISQFQVTRNSDSNPLIRFPDLSVWL